MPDLYQDKHDDTEEDNEGNKSLAVESKKKVSVCPLCSCSCSRSDRNTGMSDRLQKNTPNNNCEVETSITAQAKSSRTLCGCFTFSSV